jgi:hypothetical protein
VTDAPGTIELRRGGTALAVGVGAGAPLSGLWLADAEWCGAGPWMERAPSVAACTMPTFVPGVAGRALPAGGVLAAQVPGVQVTADGRAEVVRAAWDSVDYPLALTREASLTAEGAVRLRYEATHTQRVPIPFVWGLVAPVVWAPGVRIEMPAGARARIAGAWGEALPAVGSEFGWPHVRCGGALLDLGSPTTLPRGVGLTVFVELPRHGFTLRTRAGALCFDGTRGVVTHVRVHVAHDAPFPDRPPTRWWWWRAKQQTLEVGLTVGAPDQLSDAVGSWKSARAVEAGTTLGWELTVAAADPPEEA